MFKAETPGPMKDSKMTPRIAETAKGLWLVYTLISIFCVLGYRWAGMTWLDAIMHMFSTMGLGGFSSHDASFGFFDSPAIEAVSITFMLIAGCNFATHYVVLSGYSFRPYLTDPEAGAFILVTVGSVIGIAIFLDVHGVYPAFSEALRFSAFNVVSIATTTGFANTDYALWPFCAPLWMLFLSSFATSAGSTGGGIKMIRAIVLYKQVYRELTRAMHPYAVHPVKIGSEGLHRLHDPCPVVLRTRNNHGLFGGRGQHQQHRAWPGSGGAGQQLRWTDRLPDLGVHLRHASRPPGNFHLVGRHDPGFLAQVTGKSG
jgi:trk system potassium uptake protein TrkH